MPNRQDIIDEAEKYLGAPFLHQGRAQSGMDCCGLVIVVGNALGLIDYQAFGYSRRTTGLEFLQHFLDAGLIRKPLSQMSHGDVIITKDGRFPCHCGFIDKRGEQPIMIHAWSRRRAVVRTPIGPNTTWAHDAVCAFSLPGVED